jgi:3-hydroxyisobutyrate dehydrogenase-like beta-hydroxyacid dehydrogenase
VMVSGFPEKAESGELTLMVGGAASVAARCEPYLTAIGARWFHAGPVGAGAVAKLANNLMWKFNMVGAFEGLAVARAGGVDPAVMASIALASSGQSEALRRWQEIGGRDKHSPAIWEGGITPGYDRIITEAVDIARAQGTDLPAASAIIDLTREPPPEAGWERP